MMLLLAGFGLSFAQNELEKSQSNFHPYIQAGMMNYKLAPNRSSSGPWVNVGFKFFRDRENWFADASFAYTNYTSEENVRSYYIHYRGGVGLTNRNNLFAGIYLGYLESWDRRGKVESPTLDFSATFYPVQTERWALHVTGTIGSSLSGLKYSEQLNASLLTGGTLGLNWKFGYKSAFKQSSEEKSGFVDPYLQGGFLSYKVKPDLFVLGSWINTGARYYTSHSPLFVDASVAYTDYSVGTQNVAKFAHLRGGFGFTDSRNIFGGLYLGYLANTDQEDRLGSATIDVSVSVYPVIQNGWALNVMGLFGTSFGPLKKTVDLDAIAFIGGGIGFTWIIEHKKRKTKKVSGSD